MAKTFSRPPSLRKSIAGFGVSILGTFVAVAAPTTSADPNTQPEATLLPSRYSSIDADAYVLAVSSRLAIATRTVDPFGKAQDPSAKPIQPKVVKTQTNKGQTGSGAKPFSDVVKLIRVTTVMPGESRFLVGTRSISRGDTLPLVVQGRHYRVQVVEVTSQRILFRDLDNAEDGELRLDVMPQGMSRGIRGVLAPGMQPTKADAPLEIDSPGSLR